MVSIAGLTIHELCRISSKSEKFEFFALSVHICTDGHIWVKHWTFVLEFLLYIFRYVEGALLLGSYHSVSI